MASNSSSSTTAANRSTIVPISECVRSAIQRSLCAEHYTDFQSFHENLQAFGEKMDRDWEGRHAHLMEFFPPPRMKVGRIHWVNFRSWLNYGLGEAVKDICNPWVDYGLSKIRTCERCRVASKYVPPPPTEEVIEISKNSSSVLHLQ